MAEAFAQLRAAKIDGRTENVRYRQNELQSLHKTLRDNADLICEAIQKDTQGPRAEIDSEYYMGMLAIRDAYQSLDFSKELKEEYLISKGKDNETRRVGYGIVFIRPTTHTRFFSIVAPLALAIAAGNCVLLELPQTLSNLDQVLKTTLSEALDQDTFIMANDEIKDKQLLSECLVVDQTGSSDGQSPLQLLSQPSARTIAIVDRTADIQKAAKAIVAARFTYRGRSPYSPDIVLVNEFKKKEFFEACVRFTSQYMPAQTQSKRALSSSLDETKNKFKTAEDAGQASIFGSQEYMIADIRERNSPLFDAKVSGCHLAIAPYTSLMDVITLMESKPTLLASYLFANPPTAKFLSQYMDSHISCVNQIPLNLLIGPAAPLTHAPSPRTRYSIAMFSQPRPQYAQAPAVDVALAMSCLDSETSQAEKRGLKSKAVPKPEQLRKLATVPLPSTGQSKGGGIGFFEQGILIGLGLASVVTLPTLTFAVWFGGSKAWKALRR